MSDIVRHTLAVLFSKPAAALSNLIPTYPCTQSICSTLRWEVRHFGAAAPEADLLVPTSIFISDVARFLSTCYKPPFFGYCALCMDSIRCHGHIVKASFFTKSGNGFRHFSYTRCTGMTKTKAIPQWEAIFKDICFVKRRADWTKQSKKLNIRKPYANKIEWNRI